MKRETNTEVRELTKAELEIMQILWDKGSAFVHEIQACMPDPKPAYNTISTFVRILEKKGSRSPRGLREKPPVLPDFRTRSLRTRSNAGGRAKLFQQLVCTDGFVFFAKRNNFRLPNRKRY